MGKNKNKTYNVFIVKICRERILLKNMRNILMIVIKMFQGILIGVGAVLPGLSGGVLCVAFGIYKTVMELIANPFKNLKTHIISLAPYIIGGAIGFLGIANILSVFLEKYPAPSVCFFVGLIVGLLPSLIREAREKGDNRNSVFAAVISMEITFIILISLKILSVKLVPNFMWYIFCGACLGLSIIAPGMSFSTLLMPIGLYEPFIAGIGNIDLNVLIPGGIGSLITLVCLSKGINFLLQQYYSVTFHSIIGIVIAATIMIIPFSSFLNSFSSCVINNICILVGMVFSYMLDKFNQKFSV